MAKIETVKPELQVERSFRFELRNDGYLKIDVIFTRGKEVIKEVEYMPFDLAAINLNRFQRDLQHSALTGVQL